MSRPAGLKALIAQRNVLIALTRYLMQDRTGGVLGAAIEMLVKVLRASGALAYLMENEELVLVAHHGLPRRAKAWLTHLSTSDEPWFIAQRVCSSRRGEVDTELAAARAGLSIRPALEEARWKALAGVPLQVGRDVLGVLVIAATSEGAFDRETVNMLEAVAGILALALERERSLERAREEAARDAETAQLATMGLVASNVARELAAPVGALALQLDEQEQHLRELRRAVTDPVQYKALELLEERTASAGMGVRKIQGLTSRLLSFSRETKPEAVDLAAIVERASATARGNLEAQSIRFTVEGTDQQLVVDGREESLQMMVLQLILYAAHECEGAADQPEIALRLYRDAERHVVAVAASGRSGQQTGARLYDNITRGARQATVGLELAKQTAIMHQGRLEIGISDLGGVLVKVSLPPVSDIVGHPAAPSPGARVEEMVADAFDAAPDDMSLDLDFGLDEPPPPPFPAQGGRSSPPHAERAAHRSAPPRTRGSAPPRTEPMTRSVPSRPPMSLDLELELPGGEPITEPALEEPGFGDLFFGDDEPLVDPAAPHHGHPPVDLGPAPNAPPLVLWIDHEVEAARILGGTLDGREVVVVGSAAEGREAMALLDRLPEVVFCAVALPDGSGPELHAEAPADLASRFVFIVGGLVGGDLAAYVQRSGCRTLIKPLTPDEVGGMLAEAAAVPEPTPSEPYADDSSFALSLANAEFGDLGIDDLDKDW